MKRLIYAMLSIVLALPAMAQGYGRQYNAPVRHHFGSEHNVYYGLRLGLALATVNSDDAMLDGGSMQSGLNLGGIIGFQLSPQSPVFLESGLLYTEKGGKGTYQGAKFTYSLNYFEMPIVVKYKYELEPDVTLQPFAGGYLAMGIGGKIKDYKEKASMSSFSADFFKRFDGGLRLGVGLEYQMLYAEMAYDLGLANICHSDFDTSHNSCFSINVGVNF